MTLRTLNQRATISSRASRKKEDGLRTLLSATSRPGSFGLLFSFPRRIFSPSLPTSSARRRYSFRIPTRILPGLNPCSTANPRTLVTKVDSWKWELAALQVRFSETASRYLPSKPSRSRKNPDCVLACGVLFDYLRETQRDFLPRIEFPKVLRHRRLH